LGVLGIGAGGLGVGGLDVRVELFSSRHRGSWLSHFSSTAIKSKQRAARKRRSKGSSKFKAELRSVAFLVGSNTGGFDKGAVFDF
jgi:hypothetical protein